MAIKIGVYFISHSLLNILLLQYVKASNWGWEMPFLMTGLCHAQGGGRDRRTLFPQFCNLFYLGVMAG